MQIPVCIYAHMHVYWTYMYDAHTCVCVYVCACVYAVQDLYTILWLRFTSAVSELRPAPPEFVVESPSSQLHLGGPWFSHRCKSMPVTLQSHVFMQYGVVRMSRWAHTLGVPRNHCIQQSIPYLRFISASLLRLNLYSMTYQTELKWISHEIDVLKHQVRTSKYPKK